MISKVQKTNVGLHSATKVQRLTVRITDMYEKGLTAVCTVSILKYRRMHMVHSKRSEIMSVIFHVTSLIAQLKSESESSDPQVMT